MDDIPIVYCNCYDFLKSLKMYEGYGVIYTYEYKSKYYVGQTNYPIRRHWNHRGSSHQSRQIINDILSKHREILPKFVWMGDRGKIDDAERYFIEKFDSAYPDGYNLESGGCRFKNLGESTRIKISKANKKPILQYSIEGQFIREYDSLADAVRDLGFSSYTPISSCIHGNNYTAYGFRWKLKESEDYPLQLEELKRYQMHLSDEDRRKRGERLKEFRQNMTKEQKEKYCINLEKSRRRGTDHPLYGRPRSDETKEKLRKAHLGRKYPERSGVNHPMFGKHLTEEEKRIRSEKTREMWENASEEQKENWRQAQIESASKRMKPILQYDLDGNFVREWDNSRAIKNELGLDNNQFSNIRSNIYGHSNCAYGSQWTYKTDNYPKKIQAVSNYSKSFTKKLPCNIIE